MRVATKGFSCCLAYVDSADVNAGARADPLDAGHGIFEYTVMGHLGTPYGDLRQDRNPR